MNVWNCIRWMATSLGFAAVLAGPLADNMACAQKPKPDAKTKSDKGANQNPGQPAAGMEIAKVEGKWDAFQQGIIKILNAENQEVFLQSENDTLLRYSAEAEPSWLMPGYMVRFSATFDQNYKPTAPLKTIEVFTPMTRRRMTPEEIREQTPGINLEGKGPPQDAKGLFTDNKKPQPPAKGKSNKKEPAITAGQSFRVVGQIGNIQNNVLTVMASTPIQIEIDPTAVVTVTANDMPSAMNMIAKGDSVSVSGLRNPAQPNQVYCEQITIKAAKKLTQVLPQAKKGKGSPRDKDKDDPKNAKNTKDSKDKPDVKKSTSTDKKPQ